MYLKHLSLGNFRNYETAEISLSSGINLLVGPNGQGKTNLVEAVRYLSSLSSHRVAGYLPLIRQSQNQAIIRASVAFEDREIQLELELNRDTANKARVNKSPVTKLRDVLGYLNSVTFAPEDLDIVKRDPSARRAFIDELVIQVWPRFVGIYSDFDRVLKQRNTLLKTARATKTVGGALSTLDAWDESLIEYGSDIVSARIKLVDQLRPFLTSAYQKIAIANNEPRILVKSSLMGSAIPGNNKNFAVGLSPAGLPGGLDDDEDGLEWIETSDKAEIVQLYRQKLALTRQKELERGISLVGPHRDDLVLMLGTLPAKGYASHGESWSYALALRLASIELLRKESRLGDPVLILDDVFAELDSGRRERLAALISDNEQVIITAAVAEDVPKSLLATVFNVKAGVITNAI
ncbi:MAG: hypothetical protein RI933_984 [Actinomycetota bacterium]